MAERAAEKIVAAGIEAAGADDTATPDSKVVQYLRRALQLVDPAFRSDNQATLVLKALREGLQVQNQDRASQGIKRAVVDLVVAGASKGPGSFSASAACQLLGADRKNHAKRKAPDIVGVAASVSSSAESFAKKAKTRSDAFGLSVAQSVAEFSYCYCKFEEKTFACLLSVTGVWAHYCCFHDAAGNFFPRGSPDWLDWNMALLDAEINDAPFDWPKPQPISRTTFGKLFPKDITKEKWRSCACTICSEVEDLFGAYGKLMTVLHSRDGKDAKGELGRKLRQRCDATFDDCRWKLPSADPLSLHLPRPWPTRFKNTIAKPGATSVVSTPSLFCTACGCGCCSREAGHGGPAGGGGGGKPAWQICRDSECPDCGFAKKFAPCPAVLAMKELMNFRVLESHRLRVQWLDANPLGDVGESPSCS